MNHPHSEPLTRLFIPLSKQAGRWPDSFELLQTTLCSRKVKGVAVFSCLRIIYSNAHRQSPTPRITEMSPTSAVTSTPAFLPLWSSERLYPPCLSPRAAFLTGVWVIHTAFSFDLWRLFWKTCLLGCGYVLFSRCPYTTVQTRQIQIKLSATLVFNNVYMV